MGSEFEKLVNVFFCQNVFVGLILHRDTSIRPNPLTSHVSHDVILQLMANSE